MEKIIFFGINLKINFKSLNNCLLQNSIESKIYPEIIQNQK